MNDRLPLEGVLPMHCSANVDDDGRVAVFFGLSGTGQDDAVGRSRAAPDRRRRARLVGHGVFNFEGGCYAKVIRLSAEAEPQIYATTRTFGTVLENVVMDERGVLDLDDDSKTENTRAAYKLEQIANALPAKRAGHPSSVVFLTADAFGVLPPIARLTREQAMYYFLSGFTAKVAGTEIGVTEPQPTFSACFGAPFLPQPPAVYARHARREARRGTARQRLARQHRLDRRARSAKGGACRSRRRVRCSMRRSPASSTRSPTASTRCSASRCRSSVPGVDSQLLDPRSTWRIPTRTTPRPRARQMFLDNFARFDDVAPAWPRPGRALLA